MSNSANAPSLSWNDFTQGPIEKIDLDWQGSEVFIKRLDLIQSWASGNKYYKLKHNIADALAKSVPMLVSKGGMFSNHLEAFAKACFHFNLKCICMVRSYNPDEQNPSIQNLRSYNAEIHYLNPTAYNAFDALQSESLFPEALFIPEGGGDENGIRGAAELGKEIENFNADYLIIAGGTMSTAAGLLSVSPKRTKVIIVAGWKGCKREYVEEVLRNYHIHPTCEWDLWSDHHFGGFGKYDERLRDFMYSFSKETLIPLDPVYTGKMMFGIREKIREGYFIAGSRILAIHTGGLQGIAGFQYRDPGVWNDYAGIISHGAH